VAEVAIELVDAGLLALRGEQLSEPSPGVALLDPAGITIGRAAAAQLRLRPVQALDRYWADLNVDALPRPLPGLRSHADLGYRHLAQLWGEVAEPGDEAFMVVPGSLKGEALGLAAGIARAAGIPVAGWIDAAVAACAGLAARETVLHLDVQLHQAVLTVLGGTDRLVRQRVEVTPRVGLKPLFAAWGQLIAGAMVRRTRFDPLHQAATEQQLLDRLPHWLQALASAESVDVQVEAPAGVFSVTLPREQFVFAAESWYSQLLDVVAAVRRAGVPVTIALSARAALLPGLATRCAGLAEAEIIQLPAAAALRAALAQADAIRGPEPALVTALPRAVPAPRAALQAKPRGERPTHLLFAGRAHAITAEPLRVGLAAAGARSLVLPAPAAGVSREHCELLREGDEVLVRDLSRYGTFVNGERVVETARLAAGDRLRLGRPGVSLELVAVD
jgi:hypothetical protein